jgi:hypothetical protein
MLIVATSVAVATARRRGGEPYAGTPCSLNKRSFSAIFTCLTESIRLGWADVASKPMRPKDRQELRKHIAALVMELARLLGMLD